MEQLKKMYGKQLPFIAVVDSADQKVEIGEEEEQDVKDFITTAIEQCTRGQNCDLDVLSDSVGRSQVHQG